jgi:hypothetical protein
MNMFTSLRLRKTSIDTYTAETVKVTLEKGGKNAN